MPPFMLLRSTEECPPRPSWGADSSVDLRGPGQANPTQPNPTYLADLSVVCVFWVILPRAVGRKSLVMLRRSKSNVIGRLASHDSTFLLHLGSSSAMIFCHLEYIFTAMEFCSFMKLTLSHPHDVPNVTFLPSPHADKTLRTSSPQCQVGKAGVRGFYIIKRAGLKGF